MQFKLVQFNNNTRKFLTQSKNLNTSRRWWVLTNEEKWEFVKTSVSWIYSKDKIDSCFILNFGYEAPIPWPQVSIVKLRSRSRLVFDHVKYFLRD